LQQRLDEQRMLTSAALAARICRPEYMPLLSGTLGDPELREALPLADLKWASVRAEVSDRLQRAGAASNPMWGLSGDLSPPHRQRTSSALEIVSPRTGTPARAREPRPEQCSFRVPMRREPEPVSLETLARGERWSTAASRRGVHPALLKREPDLVMEAFAKQGGAALQRGVQARKSKESHLKSRRRRDTREGNPPPDIGGHFWLHPGRIASSFVGQRELMMLSEALAETAEAERRLRVEIFGGAMEPGPPPWRPAGAGPPLSHRARAALSSTQADAWG
jgi:hypothetical protein